MPWYSILIVSLVFGLLIFWLVKGNGTSSKVVTIAVLVLVLVILPEIPLEAIVSYKLGPLEIKQDVERVKSIKNEVLAVKRQIDSTSTAMAALSDSTREMVMTLAELSVLTWDVGTAPLLQGVSFNSSTYPIRDSLQAAINRRRSKLMEFLEMDSKESLRNFVEMHVEMGALPREILKSFED